MIIFLLSHTPCSHEYDVDDAGDADDAGDDEDDDDGVDIDEDENDTNDAWVMQARKSDDPLPSSFPFSRSQPSFPAAAPINYHTDSNVGDNDDDEMMMMKTTVMTAMMMLMMMTAMTMHWLIREVQQCCGLLIPRAIQLPGSQQHCIYALCFCVFVHWELCICVKHNVYIS